MNTMQTSHINRYNAFCALLLAILVVLQFVPFWELNGEQVSISGYVWLPTEHTELTSYFADKISPEFKVDSLVLSSLLQLVVPVAGIVLFLYDRESIFVPCCTAAAGAGGVWSFLCKPAFRFGMNWPMHFAFTILLFAVAMIPLVVRLTSARWRNK